MSGRTPALASDAIAIDGAPSIPGLRFRHYRGPQDHPEMVRVSNVANDANHDPEMHTVPGMDHDYAHLTNSDPFRDVVMAEVDGLLVGYGRVEWEDTEWDGRAFISFGYVHPEWRHRGIGGAMLRRNEQRLREILRSQAYDGKRRFVSYAADPDEGNARLLAREGYQPVRHFYEMVRPNLEDIEIPDLPPGLEIRPLTPDVQQQVYLWEADAFRDHWGGTDTSEEGYRRWAFSPLFDPSLMVVAWDGGEVAGGVFNAIDPAENEHRGIQRGWLDSVFTRRPWRRRGLARALIGRSLVLLAERGMTSAALGVDVQNPNEALALYESAGFHPASSATAWAKPMEGTG